MNLSLWALLFHSHTKTNPKLLQASPNSDPNKPWIIIENKVLIKPKT
jgi:hypothetical protein